MVIGITGQIGSGKTTAAGILASPGGVIVDADLIGKQVVETNRTLLRSLARRFGDDILTPGGRLRRKRLARRAFAERKATRDLERLVHPPLLRELRKQVRTQEKTGCFVIIDAALLLDWDLDREVDFVLVVHAGRRLRLARLRAKGLSAEDAKAREALQLPFGIFRERADRIILNNTTRSDLRRKLGGLRRYLKRIRLTD
jgi:dephospho-CoA kinase